MTITEVSKQFGITAHTLRYYERVGLIPPVNRNGSGIRDYTEGDCHWVNFATLMRSAGVQIEALIEYVTLFQQGDSTKSQRKQILLEQRIQLAKRIEDMSYTLDRLNMKIEYYADTVAKIEEDLSNIS